MLMISILILYNKRNDSHLQGTRGPYFKATREAKLGLGPKMRIKSAEIQTADIPTTFTD